MAMKSRQYDALCTDHEALEKATAEELLVVEILVESELPYCEECGSGTFSWEEARSDPHILSQKLYVARSIIEVLRKGQGHG